MSITFGGEELFDSGPARVHVDGPALRHATEPTLSARGTRVFSQGTTPRTITQTGLLVADTPEDLHSLVNAIEHNLDGIPRTLVDHLDRERPGVVMLEFHPGAFTRLGTRWKADYRIEYTQP